MNTTRLSLPPTAHCSICLGRFPDIWAYKCHLDDCIAGRRP